MTGEDSEAQTPRAKRAPSPFEAMQQAASAAMQAPWQLATRVGDVQQQIAEEWRRGLQSVAGSNAVFKTRVQKSGRVSIPDAERDALGIEEGDLVQVIVIPISKSKKNKD